MPVGQLEIRDKEDSYLVLDLYLTRNTRVVYQYIPTSICTVRMLCMQIFPDVLASFINGNFLLSTAGSCRMEKPLK